MKYRMHHALNTRCNIYQLLSVQDITVSIGMTSYTAETFGCVKATPCFLPRPLCFAFVSILSCTNFYVFHDNHVSISTYHIH